LPESLTQTLKGWAGIMVNVLLNVMNFYSTTSPPSGELLTALPESCLTSQHFSLSLVALCRSRKPP